MYDTHLLKPPRSSTLAEEHLGKLFSLPGRVERRRPEAGHRVSQRALACCLWSSKFQYQYLDFSPHPSPHSRGVRRHAMGAAQGGLRAWHHGGGYKSARAQNRLTQGVQLQGGKDERRRDGCSGSGGRLSDSPAVQLPGLYGCLRCLAVWLYGRTAVRLPGFLCGCPTGLPVRLPGCFRASRALRPCAIRSLS